MDKLIAFLQLLKPISVADRALIAEAFIPKSFTEGDYLFDAGHICKQMFFICSGVLRIVALNEKGVEMTHFFLKENQFCTILHSFENDTVSETGIKAACECEVLVISRDTLYVLYQKLPWLRTLLDAITRQALMDKINMQTLYFGHDSATRYRLFIMRQPEIALRVPLNSVASYLGITPQSLSRIRKSAR
jgi:CRP-like cAMP-binding protein